MGETITSLESFLKNVMAGYSKWNTTTFPWFRGEPDAVTALLPSVFRKTKDGRTHNESQLLQQFRIKAPTLGSGVTPDKERIDEWLFLAQHVGLPTRLLDWSEGALVALYFALEEENPVIWMLDPVELNRQSTGEQIEDNDFSLTWLDSPEGKRNFGHENIAAAWGGPESSLELPIAMHPTNIHPRMSAQRSSFTVHGSKKEPLHALVGERILLRFKIEPTAISQIRGELRMMGITQSSVFPDLDALSRDLASIY